MRRRGAIKINEMHIPLIHVNAFTSAPFRGNPAAVCLLDSWLDDSLMLKVAAENALPATAFLVASGDGYSIRWFTGRCEVKLCGHATLASGYVLLRLLRPELQTIRFETRYRGVVSVRKNRDLLEMDFPRLETTKADNPPGDLPHALGISASPIELLQGNDSLIAIFENESVIREIHPNFEMLRQMHPTIVMVTAPGKDCDFVSRYFAPSYGVPEDPVTGSAHCALAPYWAKRLGKALLHAKQLSERGGELWCEVAGDRVMLKGNAVLTFEGKLSF